MTDAPVRERVYKSTVADSTRWEQFNPRDGDVVICTSYKAGTTWTQMICALLIHQSPDLPQPLSRLSPWLDMQTANLDEVLATYESQTHRRFIKTHTALDGLPYYPNVTYLYCGRDPRDVFMSWQNHVANLDVMQFGQRLAEAGAAMTGPPAAMPEDVNERFKMWMTMGSNPWEQDGFPQWSHFHHAWTFWRHRHLANIHFLHYADLKADLEGQMRRVAAALGIEVPEARWPALVKAATFEEMKAKADRTAPNSHQGIWLDNSNFFNKGANAQWRGALSPESLALYEQVKAERFEPVFAEWLEKGSGVVGDPKSH